MADPAKTSSQGGEAAKSRPHRPLRAVTLVFTDLQDSTGLKQRLGDASAVPLIERHRRLVHELVATAGGEHGRVVNNAGDGFLLTFAAPTAALRFALALQQAHADDRALPAVRIGIHQGEVALADDDSPLDGVEVDTAARLGALAGPGQVLMSVGALRSAKAHLRTDGRGRPIAWRHHGDFLLKGLRDPVTVGEAGIEGLSPLAPPRRDSPAIAPGARGRNILASRALAVAASLAVVALSVLVPYMTTKRQADAEPASGDIAQHVTPTPGQTVMRVVSMRQEWGRAGHPGGTFARPARAGPDDYLNLYVSAGENGHVYIFRVQPEGSAAFQPPDYRDAGGACEAVACVPGSEQLFATYRLNDPPGDYSFVAVLTREPMRDICGYVEKHLDASGREVGAAVGEVLAAFAHRDRVIGHTHFSYTVGGE
ncbi:MAG: adenylate/guanylate cyclase domain-containing protein [Planctomycetota bacterium]|jgi:class 3 adenylate cyclase